MKSFIVFSLIALTGCIHSFEKDCVKEGMTAEEVRNKCGNPEEMISSSDKNSNWKVYIYGTGGMLESSFICFRNDKVTTYQVRGPMESSLACYR